MSDPTRTPLRVLFLIDNLRPGGCQKAAIAICRSLVSRGDSVTVWRLGGTSPEIESGFSSAGAVMRGGSQSGLGALMRLPGLVRHLRRERVDIVQTFLFHSDIAGRVAGRLARIGTQAPASSSAPFAPAIMATDGGSSRSRDSQRRWPTLSHPYAGRAWTSRPARRA